MPLPLSPNPLTIPMRLNLATLHDRILYGDEEAEVELYQWIHAHKYVFAGRSFWMAEEIATHTYTQLVAFIRAGKIKIPHALYAVADVIALRYRRTLHHRERIYGELRSPNKTDRERGVDTLALVPDSSPLVLESMHLMELKQQLIEAIGGLSLERAEIIRRYYYDEQTQEQIRSELNLTPTQFRLHKSRALATIRKRVGVKRNKQKYQRRAK